MTHQPGCPQDAGGDCDCFRFGDVVHYRWQDEHWSEDQRQHSAALVVGMSPRTSEEVILLALSDTNFVTTMQARPVAKNVHGYVPCDATCPFNPEYEGETK